MRDNMADKTGNISTQPNRDEHRQERRRIPLDGSRLRESHNGSAGPEKKVAANPDLKRVAVKQDGWGVDPKQTTRSSQSKKSEHPTVATVSQATNMPHIALVDWSVATPEGADSGMFSINLTAPMMMRLVRNNDDDQSHTLLVLTRQEEVARVKATATGASELYADMWKKLSAMRDNIAAQYMSEPNQQYRVADQRGQGRQELPRHQAGVEARRPSSTKGESTPETGRSDPKKRQNKTPDKPPQVSSVADLDRAPATRWFQAGNLRQHWLVILVSTIFALVVAGGATWLVLQNKNTGVLATTSAVPSATMKEQPETSVAPPDAALTDSKEADKPWMPAE